MCFLQVLTPYRAGLNLYDSELFEPTGPSKLFETIRGVFLRQMSSKQILRESTLASHSSSDAGKDAFTDGRRVGAGRGAER